MDEERVLLEALLRIEDTTWDVETARLASTAIERGDHISYLLEIATQSADLEAVVIATQVLDSVGIFIHDAR